VFDSPLSARGPVTHSFDSPREPVIESPLSARITATYSLGSPREPESPSVKSPTKSTPNWKELQAERQKEVLESQRKEQIIKQQKLMELAREASEKGDNPSATVQLMAEGLGTKDSKEKK